MALYRKSIDKCILCVYVQDIVMGVLEERRNLVSVHKDLAECLGRGHRYIGKRTHKSPNQTNTKNQNQQPYSFVYFCEYFS